MSLTPCRQLRPSSRRELSRYPVSLSRKTNSMALYVKCSNGIPGSHLCRTVQTVALRAPYLHVDKLQEFVAEPLIQRLNRSSVSGMRTGYFV